MAMRARLYMRKRPEFLGVLALRDYRNYWLSRGFSDIGLNLWFLAAAWLTLELTDSQAWVGLVGGIAAVPAIAITLFAVAAVAEPITVIYFITRPEFRRA